MPKHHTVMSCSLMELVTILRTLSLSFREMSDNDTGKIRGIRWIRVYEVPRAHQVIVAKRLYLPN